MRKLLSANFARLWKDRIFWLEMIFMFGLGIFVVCSRYSDIVRYEEQAHLDDTLFVYVTFVSCCSAIFCSMFSGTEYSDGTIRNKLAVGHLRSSIYLSNWLVSVAAVMIMAAVFLLSYCTLGSFLLDASNTSIGEIILYAVVGLFTIVAYTSVFYLLSMLIAKKSAAAVVCLLVFWGLMIVALTIQASLNAPEFVTDYMLTIDGLDMTEPRPNPKYLQPAARRVYQFFLDILPSGQEMQLSTLDVLHPFLCIMYSTVISIITTVLGIFAFEKKNIK